MFRKNFFLKVVYYFYIYISRFFKYNLTKESGEIVENEELKDPFNCIFNETIRLYLGIITSDGKLTTLTNLKKFKIGSAGSEGYFYEISNNTRDEETSTDYDDYRTLVS